MEGKHSIHDSKILSYLDNATEVSIKLGKLNQSDQIRLGITSHFKAD